MSEQKKNAPEYPALRASSAEANRITRESLHIALLQLMRETDFDDISITELTKRSGVSRTAFYRNYNSKLDILNEIYDNLVKALQKELGKPEFNNDPKKALTFLLTKFKEHAGELKILMEIHFPDSLKIGPIMTSVSPQSDAKQHYRQIALEGAFRYFANEWIQNGAKESPEEMTELFFGLWNLQQNS